MLGFVMDRACIQLQAKKNGFDHSKVEMAVIVQSLIPADVAGVIFTSDPVTGDNNRVVIEACLGLGDALVSGKVSPYRLFWTRRGQMLFHVR